MLSALVTHRTRDPPLCAVPKGSGKSPRPTHNRVICEGLTDLRLAMRVGAGAFLPSRQVGHITGTRCLWLRAIRGQVSAERTPGIPFVQFSPDRRPAEQWTHDPLVMDLGREHQADEPYPGSPVGIGRCLYALPAIRLRRPIAHCLARNAPRLRGTCDIRDSVESEG
jgi:hypothetical protein